MGRFLNQDIDDNNSMVIEDNCVNNHIAEDRNGFFRDDLWWENNSEESSPVDENINDIHPDINNNSNNVEL